MSTIIAIILVSLFFHYISVVYLTFSKFKNRGHTIQLLPSFMLPLLLTKIHISLIAKHWKTNKDYAKCMLKTIILAYNIPLLILVEYVNAKVEVNEVQLAPKNQLYVFKTILSSMYNANYFEYILNHTYSKER